MQKETLKLLFMLSICLMACRKDNPVDTIRIGDHKGMIVTNYDSKLLKAYEYNFLDINNDGFVDIKISGDYWYEEDIEPNNDDVVSVEIESLSDTVQFFGIFKIDTLFSHNTKEVYEVNDKVWVDDYEHITCERKGVDDNVHSVIEKVKIKALNEDDVLHSMNIEDSFFSGKYTLFNKKQKEFPWLHSAIDTVVRKIITYYPDCTLFPKSDTKFIGYRFANDGRLGWLKIQITNDLELMLIENSIQEK